MRVPAEAEPDIKTAPFTFILDLEVNGDMIDNGKLLLPTQNAMKLAPAEVRGWVEQRPEPDDCIGRPVPLLEMRVPQHLDPPALNVGKSWA